MSDSIQSPSGRWVITIEEAARTCLTMEKRLEAGKWSLADSEGDRLSVAIGTLLGTMSVTRGFSEDEAIEMIDDELIFYATKLLATFERGILERQVAE